MDFNQYTPSAALLNPTDLFLIWNTGVQNVTFSVLQSEVLSPFTLASDTLLGNGSGLPNLAGPIGVSSYFSLAGGTLAFNLSANSILLGTTAGASAVPLSSSFVLTNGTLSLAPTANVNLLTLSATTGIIDTLTSNATINANLLNVATETATSSTITDANISTLTAASAIINGETVTTSTIGDASIGSLTATDAIITTGSISNGTISTLIVNHETASYSTIGDATITSANITTSTVGTETVNSLTATDALITTGSISTANITTLSVANENIVASTITNATLLNATIDTATISGVNASTISTLLLESDTIANTGYIYTGGALITQPTFTGFGIAYNFAAANDADLFVSSGTINGSFNFYNSKTAVTGGITSISSSLLARLDGNSNLTLNNNLTVVGTIVNSRLDVTNIGTATIGTLNSDIQIGTSSTIDFITVGTSITAPSASIASGIISTLSTSIGTIATLNNTTLSSADASISSLTAINSTLSTVTSTLLTANTLNATDFTTSNLKGTLGTVTTFTAPTFNSTIASLATADITSLSVTTGTITTLYGTSLNYNSGAITSLTSTLIETGDIIAAGSAVIEQGLTLVPVGSYNTILIGQPITSNTSGLLISMPTTIVSSFLEFYTGTSLVTSIDPFGNFFVSNNITASNIILTTGTIGTLNTSNAIINGGSINSTPIGNVNPSTGQFSSLSITTSNPANLVFATPTAAAGGAQLRALTPSDVPFAELTSHKGVADGYAPLDSNALVPLSYLPASVVGSTHYEGTWDASTNSPPLTSSTAPNVATPNGAFYVVSTAGTTTLDGINVWNVGDWLIFNGTWEKLDGQVNPVTSVAGKHGAVTLTVTDVSGAAPIASPTFTGTVVIPAIVLSGGQLNGSFNGSTTFTGTALYEGTLDVSAVTTFDGNTTFNSPVSINTGVNMTAPATGSSGIIIGTSVAGGSGYIFIDNSSNLVTDPIAVYNGTAQVMILSGAGNLNVAGDIQAGALNATVIGNLTPATGTFTSVNINSAAISSISSTNVSATSLSVSGTASIGTELIINTGATVASTTATAIIRNGSQELLFIPQDTAAGYNPLVSANDAAIIATNTSAAAAQIGLFIGPNSGTAGGIRIDSTGLVTLGNGLQVIGQASTFANNVSIATTLSVPTLSSTHQTNIFNGATVGVNALTGSLSTPLLISGDYTSNGSGVIIDISGFGSTAVAAPLAVKLSADNKQGISWISTNGTATLNMTWPNFVFSNDVFVPGLSASGNVTISGVLDATGGLTLSSGVISAPTLDVTSISTTGNVSVGGQLSASGITYLGYNLNGAIPDATAVQGVMVGWNATGTNGETDLVNIQGNEGNGGFNFYNQSTTVNTTVTPSTTSFTNALMASIRQSGMVVYGSISATSGLNVRTEADFANYNFTDPEYGVARDAKFGNAGIAVGGGAFIIGGVTADTATITSATATTLAATTGSITTLTAPTLSSTTGTIATLNSTTITANTASLVTTPAFGDNSGLVATTAFVQQHGGIGAWAYATSSTTAITLTSSAYGKIYQVQPGATVVLPPSSLDGGVIRFYGQGPGTFTLQTQGAVNFLYAPSQGYNANTITTMTIDTSGDVVLYDRGSGEWDVVAGSFFITQNDNNNFTGNLNVAGTLGVTGETYLNGGVSITGMINVIAGSSNVAIYTDTSSSSFGMGDLVFRTGGTLNSYTVIDQNGTINTNGVVTSGKITAGTGLNVSAGNISVTNTAAGAEIIVVGNGTLTPSKTLRVQNGTFQVLNDAGATSLLTIDDTGNATIAGGATINSNLKASIISPPSSMYNQNLLPNSSFLYGYTGWDAPLAGMGIGYDASATYLNYNGTVTTALTYNSSSITNPYPTGNGINLSGWVFNAGGGGPASIGVACFNSGGTAISTIAVSTLAAGAGWTFLTANGTIPTLTSYFKVSLGFTGATSATNVAFSELKLEPGSAATLWSEEASSQLLQNGSFSPTFSNGTFSGTGDVLLPVGSTAQRPTGNPGMIRFNSDVNEFEGYNGSAWGSLGGGATGGGSDKVFVQNQNTINNNYTIPVGYNASSVGPLTIATGVTVSISSGSRWVVL